VGTVTNSISGKRQLFGTDGIRGVAGEYPLDRPTVEVIGRALGSRLVERKLGDRAVIGQDTRESSEWIAEALAKGLTARGISVTEAGVITTPGVAFLARKQKFAAGVVISASHNPWQDNGIKVFGGDGFKLSDDVEHEIEREIFRQLEAPDADAYRGELEPIEPDPQLHRAYVDWLVSNVGQNSLRGLKAYVDCGNGATTALAPEVFTACGVQATFMNVEPNGRNINANCGALHPEVVAGAVQRANGSGGKFDLGVTFDGDGDRALFCDAAGNIVNGDAVLLLVARAMKARGTLAKNTVVATTMSNMGLEAVLRHDGLHMLRAPVGDKYVLEQMQKTGAKLGGEQSGHIIFLDGESTTGDGLLTALRVMEVIATAGKPLAELVQDLHVFPQVIKNVRVREKKPFSDVPALQAALKTAEEELGEDGRLVVRYSGTEKLARVMVEAASEDKMNRIADHIAGVIQRELGA
jgi:phosphoglucosamine mutase